MVTGRSIRVELLRFHAVTLFNKKAPGWYHCTSGVDPTRINQNGCEKSIRLCELLLLASTSTPTLGLAVQAGISSMIIAYRTYMDMTLTHFIVKNSTNLSGWRNIYRVFKIKRLDYTYPPQIEENSARDADFVIYLLSMKPRTTEDSSVDTVAFFERQNRRIASRQTPYFRPCGDKSKQKLKD